MAFDGIVMRAIFLELHELVLGARIDRVHQPAADTLVLHLRKEGVTRHLLFSAHARHARVHLAASPPPNPASPPTFCMVLRKHLEGGRIAAIRQPGLERVLYLEVEGRDELGRPTSRVLAAEVMGKHSNLILYDPGTGLILDGIKRYTHAVSRYRQVLPGFPYLPPPPQEKLDWLSLREDDFRRALFHAPLSRSLAKILPDTVQGLSPLITREVLFRAGLPEETRLEECGEHELVTLWRVLHGMAGDVREGHFQPVVLLEGGMAREFHALPLTHLQGLVARSFAGVNEALDYFFAARQAAESLAQGRQSLAAVIGQHLRRLEKKASLQEEELSAGKEAPFYRLAGELITANIYRLQRGQDLLVAENYYEPGAPPVEIPLDSRLTPAENAQSYFKKYGRAMKAARQAGEQLARTREEIAYLESLLFTVQEARDAADLEEIREELAAAGYLQRQPARGKASRREPARPQPRRFTSPDGLTVLVGSNNRQNDWLTRHAREDDVWLHARDIPGAHVIVRAGGGAVPPATLEFAAGLAARFSRARQAAAVPVDWTFARHVRKPPGARPGMVVYDHQQTILARPADIPEGG